MMMTTEWSLRSHWSVVTLTIHRHKRDLSHSCDILSVTHSEQLSLELFTSFVLLIIVRFKFFTLGKILRDIFLGHVESDCFIWTQASQNSVPFPLSAYIWSSSCIFRVSCWAKDSPCSCFSLSPGPLISSRGTGVWFSKFSRFDTIMPRHSGNSGHCLLCSSFSRIFWSWYSPASWDGDLWEDKMCVSCRVTAGRLMRACCDLSGALIMRTSDWWLCEKESYPYLSSKHGNKQNMEDAGRSFKNLII